MNTNLKIRLVFIGFLSIFLIIGSIFLLTYFTKNKVYTAITDAVVVEVMEEYVYPIGKPKTHRKLYYYPVYEYMVDGKIYKKQSDIGSKPAKYSVGDTLSLKYNPMNPEDVNDSGIFFLLLGIGFIVLPSCLMCPIILKIFKD